VDGEGAVLNGWIRSWRFAGGVRGRLHFFWLSKRDLIEPQDCFAVLTPYEAEPHRSMYVSLFGKDLKAGETARARARLVIGTNVGGETMDLLYSDYLRQGR